MSLEAPPPAAPPGSPQPAEYDPEKSKARLKTWFPDLAETDVTKLIGYLTQLNKFNKAVNLVSPATLKNADAVHLADAIYASQLIVPELVKDQAVYDFGSGNGFPGLVLGILNPKVQVVLVDRDERKLEFCKHVAADAGASNVKTLKSDVEALPPGTLLNVVARGFAPLAKAMLMARPLVKAGGRFFHLKGDNWATELSQVPSQLFTFWQPNLLGDYRLPDQGALMSIVITSKVSD